MPLSKNGKPEDGACVAPRLSVVGARIFLGAYRLCGAWYVVWVRTRCSCSDYKRRLERMEGEEVSGSEGQRRDMTWDWVKQPRQRRPRGTLAPPTANTQKSAVLAVNLFLSRPCVSAYSGLYCSPQPHCPPHVRIEMFSKSSDESTGLLRVVQICISFLRPLSTRRVNDNRCFSLSILLTLPSFDT